MSVSNYNLSKDFIEEVRSASDVVRVIGRFVKLRKRGKNHVGLCPFHDERTPSFNVSPDRQMFYCFGCGAGGDVFKFLMQHENMSFAEAVVDLAKEANLEIPQRSGSRRQADELAEGLVRANEAALEWFRANLAGEGGQPAREYLADRGITESAIEAFEIGFAPDSFDGLLRHLNGGFEADTLEKAGLAFRSDSGEMKDRFRRRIVVPIRSAGGRLVAFGGRILGQGEPKFLNSPETIVFHKSNNLYGLNRGSRSIKRRNFAILVEGYFDVIALHAAGFENAVAPLGTSLTEEQAKLLRRYAAKTIICMDADDAGQRAAVRAAGLLLEQGFSVNIAPLPAGEDPDSFVRQQGADAFRAVLKGSRPAYLHILEATATRYDLDRPLGQREALDELLPLLQRIGDQIERSHAISETAEMLGLEEHLVAVELGKLRSGQTQMEKQDRADNRTWLTKAEVELLVAAVRDPAASSAAVEELGVLEALSPLAQRLLEEIFKRDAVGGEISFHSLADLAEIEEERKAIAALAIEDGMNHPVNPWECAATLAISLLQRQMAELNKRITRLEADDLQADKLVGETRQLKKKIISLEKYRRGDAKH